MWIDEENGPVWMTTTLFSVFALINLCRLYFNTRVQKNYSLPPYAQVGLLECVLGLFGTEAPSFLLDLAKRTSSDIFRLPLPTHGGLHVLKSPAAMKEILQDKTSDKPSFFIPISNG